MPEQSICLTSSSSLFLIPALIAASQHLWVHFAVCMTIVVVSSHYHYTKHTSLREYLLAPDFLACAALTTSSIYLALLHELYILPTICFSVIILLFCGGYAWDTLIWSPDPEVAVVSHMTMHVAAAVAATYVIFKD
jgi:hypothetical protein